MRVSQRTHSQQRRRRTSKKRNEQDESKKKELNEKYEEIKKENSMKVWERRKDFDKIRSDEIKENPNKTWENIRKLRNQKEIKDIEIYNETGGKLDKMEIKQELSNYWGKIYQKHDNEIEYIQNQDKAYTKHTKTVQNKENRIYNKATREHFDLVMTTYNDIKEMEECKIKEEEVEQILNKIKNKKAAGPDGLKSELYKILGKDKQCLETLTKCLNYELQRNNKPKEWKISKTILLEKKKKPTVKDLRPIALTDISYKIYMTLLKNKIEHHLKINDEMLENQAGFTAGARVEDNLVILNYLKQEAQKRKDKLIITGIDFSKAYDSIKRHKIIEVLKEYKIHEAIIDSIAEIYKDDIVNLQLGNGETIQKIKVTSGIRQGCTISATLFKLISYKIIKEMDQKIKGYKTNNVNIKTLFFADDGLIISKNEEEAKKDIEAIQAIAIKYGLEINKSKSNIMIFNTKNRIEEIGGIKVVNSMKYLGITICDGKDMFQKHKENKIILAEKLANITYSVINRSCNRLLIGKTYWKNIALPAILYGSSIIDWKKREIEKLQVQQNNVCRKIMAAPRWATICALRGEIGISSMVDRINQNRLQYIRNRLKGGNELIKVIVEELENNKGKWKMNSERLCSKYKLDKEKIGEYTHNDIKIKIRTIETEKWKEEMEKKKTLVLYRKYKDSIKQNEDYYNDRRSEIWFKVKTNCLFFKKRDEQNLCKICGEENESLAHFMLHCNKLSKIRTQQLRLQRPYIENEEEILSKLIFENEEIEETKDIILKMWNFRLELIKEQ